MSGKAGDDPYVLANCAYPDGCAATFEREKAAQLAGLFSPEGSVVVLCGAETGWERLFTHVKGRTFDFDIRDWQGNLNTTEPFRTLLGASGNLPMRVVEVADFANIGTHVSSLSMLPESTAVRSLIAVQAFDNGWWRWQFAYIRTVDRGPWARIALGGNWGLCP